jgi:hypothetical protein
MLLGEYRAGLARPWNPHCNLGRQKIEVAPLVRLLHGIQEELAITALVTVVRRRWLPCLASHRELAVVYEQLEAPLRYVEPYAISVLYERERAADG